MLMLLCVTMTLTTNFEKAGEGGGGGEEEGDQKRFLELPRAEARQLKIIECNRSAIISFYREL